MKKIILFILIFVSAKSFGQQFQWTTNKSGLFQNSPIKVIPKEKVLDKLLEYFETYDYYFDGTGYTKNNFFSQLEGFNSNDGTENKSWEDFKKAITETSDLTINCIKNNLGGGSNVLVLIVNKEKVDVISFSNALSRGPISTSNGRIDDKKTRFIKFYKSLIEE